MRSMGASGVIRPLAAFLLCLAAGLAGMELVIVPGSQSAECNASSVSYVVGDGRLVKVVGDSYAAGLRVGAGKAWPMMLQRSGRRLHVDGRTGSGFVAGSCERSTFADRVTGIPAFYIVQGGLDDYAATSADVAAGLREVVAEANAPVVIVGPPAAPSRLAAARRIDRVLSIAAANEHVQYVRTIGLDLSYLGDGLHLTRAGHRRFGRFVAAAVA